MKLNWFHLALSASISWMSFASVGMAQTADSMESFNDRPWYNCLTREVWSPEKQTWCDKLSRLQNIAYRVPNYGTITLTNGRYENTEPRFSAVMPSPLPDAADSPDTTCAAS